MISVIQLRKSSTPSSPTPTTTLLRHIDNHRPSGQQRFLVSGNIPFRNNTNHNKMLSSIDISRSAFEYQALQLFTDEPDHDGIRTSNDKLKSNTVSITSTLSGVNHGLFGLIMVYASYLVVSSHTSLFPANPSLLYINLISR